MKKYKIIIERKKDAFGEETWYFEGPEGPFNIPCGLLSLHQVQLEQLLVKCGFAVEWRDE